MAVSTNLLLPYLEVSQAAKETTVNTSLSYLDDAVSGYLSKSVAGGVDVTLTEAESRNFVVELTGVITANINIIVPTREKVWIVFNNTSGAFTATWKTSAGTGVAVTQTAKALLYCNGTNVIAGPGGSGSGVTDGDKGDITVSSSGTVWTIDNDVVSNAKLANMAQSTMKGRAAGAGTGDPTDLTATQATAILDALVGDSGAGGTKGLAPAPAAGDAAAAKFLKADGTWATPASSLSGGAANKLAYWTGASALSNDTSLSWDATNDILGLIATAGGTSGVGLIALGLGTVPTTGPADTAQIFAIDEATGQTGVGFMVENAYKHLFGRQTILGSHTRSATATQGLVIDQEGNNNAILQFRSTGGGVAHGMTSIVATDIWSDFRLIASGSGGLQIRALTEATHAINISALHTTATTTLAASTDAPVMIEVGLKSGTTVTDTGADDVLFGIAGRFGANPTVWLANRAGKTWQPGPAISMREVEASTAGSGAPNVLVGSTETMKVLTNEGTTARNYHTLPSAAAGYQFTFISQDADLMRITAATGDTIRVGTNVSATAGYIENGAQGDAVTLIAINATEWVAIATVGTWTPT
jgi:hypothetical protein